MIKKLKLLPDCILDEENNEQELYYSLIDLLHDVAGLKYYRYYSVTDEKPNEKHITLLFEESNYEEENTLTKVTVEGDKNKEHGYMCFGGFHSIFRINIPEKLYVIL